MPKFSPCIIIPVYNHQRFIGGTLNSVLQYGYPVFVIDDGSEPACQQVLNQLKQDYNANPAVHFSRLAVNQGKGGAVMHGFEEAYQKGYSHALQIDADGQHDLADIPRFMIKAEQFPDAIIAGAPEYDASVPKGRLYGRYCTHIWVWIETLSFDIKDSMCGFRVYPLRPTIELMRKVPIAKRMNFDIDIIVRLYWQGVAVKNLKTRVIYPANGVSHFDMLHDNIRITKTHTWLFLGMLKNFPRLILRKFKA